jgi:hypothetical protein
VLEDARPLLGVEAVELVPTDELVGLAPMIRRSARRRPTAIHRLTALLVTLRSAASWLDVS